MFLAQSASRYRLRSSAPHSFGPLLVLTVFSLAALPLSRLRAQAPDTDRLPRIADSTANSRLAPREDISSLRVLAQADPKPVPSSPTDPPAQPAEPPSGQAKTPAAPAAAAAPGTPPVPGGLTPPGAPGGFPGRTRGARGGGPGGAAGDAAEGLKIEGDKVTLQFPNNSINDILGIYELLTGKTLIKDTNIFEGQSISLITPLPVEKLEAIKLIEAAMMTNGYVIIADPSGKSARILPTRSRDAREMQFSQGVKFYQSANDLPDNETLVSYFMKLDHMDPSQAAQTLGNHVGLSIYGRMTPVSTPPGLLITESATMVRQLISIKEVIDSEDTTNALITKFVPLKYADSVTVAQIIQSTLDAQAQDKETKGLTTIRGSGPISSRSSSSSGGPPSGSSGGSSAPQAPSMASVSTSGAGSVAQKKPQAKSQVVADPRLNQLLVVCEPSDYAYIFSLIVEFDKPVDVPVPYERKLKNVYSIDVLSVLADLLKDTGKSTSQLPGGGTLNTGAQQLVSSSSSLITGRSSSSAQQRGGTISRTGTAGGSTDTGTGGTVGSSRPDQLVESTQDNAPISVLVNKTRIIADPLANSIIVIGPKEDQDKVNMLLDKLDQKSPQAYLSTVIGELTLDRNTSSGVDWLQHFAKTGANSGIASSNINSRGDLITGNNISDVRTMDLTSAIGPAKGFNLYAQIGTALDVLISAIEVDANFKVLSRPTVFVTNNKKAVITSGQSIPVPSQSVTNTNAATAANNGNVTTTIEYKDVVLKLEVIPLIDPDGIVTLKIAQVNDTVVGQQIVAQNSVPIIGTEQLTSTVTIPSGNTIVLGGLITEQFKKDSSGVPWISRVPVLGHLFKTNADGKVRKELILFIQPQVVRDDVALRTQSLKEDLRTKVGEEAYRSFPDKPIPVAQPVIEDPPVPAVKKKADGKNSQQPGPRGTAR